MARVGDADSSFVFELSAPTAEDLRREFEDITRHLPQETEVERLEVKRIGQQKFREGLMYRWNCRCPLTGIEDSELLTASHIKPWRDSDNDERLDPDNGFLFSALWDAAFDRGLVTFGDDGEPRFSDGLSDRACKQLRWKRALQLTNRNREYLVWHRERVFQR